MIPQSIRALTILNNVFKQENIEVYLVGGCVRDLYLGRIPKDYDLASAATPSQVKDICNKHNVKFYETGLAYGTITIVIENMGFELTTFRRDIEYKDGRHPNIIVYSNKLEDDLARRDFTINAMAIMLSDYLSSNFTSNALEPHIIDIYNGINDINNMEINCVGDPSERFKEDGLRIMRAIRFAMKYDFKIGKETMDAIFKNHKSLNYISVERIRNEFNQIILNFELDATLLHEEKYLDKWKLVTFIVKKIFPEMDALAQYTHNSIYHLYDIFTHSLLVCANVHTNDISTKLAALFHDIGKLSTRSIDNEKLTNHYYKHAKESGNLANDILHRYKYSNNEINKIMNLIIYHDMDLPRMQASKVEIKKKVKRILNVIGKDSFEDWLNIKYADINNHIGLYRDEEDEKYELIEIYKEILEEKEVFSIKDLAISGDDLIYLGYNPGKLFKEILNDCLELCIKNPNYNNKEVLLEYIYEKY